MKKLAFIILTFVINACDDEQENDQYSEYPKIDNLLVTNIYGQSLGIIGPYNYDNPFVVYPNPSIIENGFSFEFEVNSQSVIEYWLEPAIFTGSDSFGTIESVRQNYNTLPIYDANSKHIYSDHLIGPGRHGFKLSNDTIQAGFYKFYLAINGKKYQENVWIQENK